MESIWNAYGIHMGVFGLLAGPAAAQTGFGPFSPEPTESCLAAAADPIGQEACIGKAAMACIDGPNGSTNVGVGFCFGAEHDFWDARLNAAYAALVALEEANTNELTELGSAAPSTADALRAMERAWIAYRDAACEYEVSTWGGGSGGGPAGAQCMMTLTGRQALALETRHRAAAGP
jgi:uncharacterized protein YecT (DUF1311 family)